MTKKTKDFDLRVRVTGDDLAALDALIKSSKLLEDRSSAIRAALREGIAVLARQVRKTG